jgi:hypothetical protein
MISHRYVEFSRHEVVRIFLRKKKGKIFAIGTIGQDVECVALLRDAVCSPKPRATKTVWLLHAAFMASAS